MFANIFGQFMNDCTDDNFAIYKLSQANQEAHDDKRVISFLYHFVRQFSL